VIFHQLWSTISHQFLGLSSFDPITDSLDPITDFDYFLDSQFRLSYFEPFLFDITIT